MSLPELGSTRKEKRERIGAEPFPQWGGKGLVLSHLPSGEGPSWKPADCFHCTVLGVLAWLWLVLNQNEF